MPTNDEIEGRERGSTRLGALQELLWHLYDKWKGEGDQLSDGDFAIGYRQAKRQDALELRSVLDEVS